MIKYFKMTMSRSFVFSGRASRQEFWWFLLISLLPSFLIGIPYNFLIAHKRDFYFANNLSLFLLVLDLFVTLILIPVYISVSVRRLHDTGKSGKWFLLNFIPIIGGIIGPESV